ncbi:MAG TPA: hypothetical protein VFH51_06960 [Myxococcota bacterium]|nr:hypothetical protein [Myxococcota bacterium]
MSDPHQSLGASLLALHAELSGRPAVSEGLRCEMKHEPVGAHMASQGGAKHPETAADAR